MANYRNISTDFWTDPKVDDEFTPEDKYFYLYLLTNPHTNICGCYEVGRKQMERETGYTWETIQRLLARFEMFGVAKYNERTKEVLIPNWGKYNWAKSEKLKIAVIKASETIKDDAYKNYVLTAISNRFTVTDTVTDTDTATVVSIGYPYRIDTVSEKPVKPKKNDFHNFNERNYDFNKLEGALVNN